ncbi:MAG: hypothetical protein HQM08_25635 [Candidatus Riflebacteria bacterium]|nr:hypothetical protein [Candidatus Riflebacteria bacterium]
MLNENEDVEKQDCETKAFYRLAEQLKERLPKTKILLIFDGLYAKGPVFSICEKYHWKYMAILKDGSIPNLTRKFEALLGLEPGNCRNELPPEDLHQVQPRLAAQEPHIFHSGDVLCRLNKCM